MSYLIKPSNRITASWDWHKSVGTTGQDWGNDRGYTQEGDKFKYPSSSYKKVGTADYSNAYCEFFNLTAPNGYKYSMRTCHVKDMVAIKDYNDADNDGNESSEMYDFHLHAQFYEGHQTEQFMQENRNGSKCLSFEDIDKKASAYKPSSTPPATKTTKGYSFNECSADNGKSFFDIEAYGATEDDLCFDVGNLKGLSNGVYKLTKAQHGYLVNTQFRKIKTTFYK